LVWPDLELVVTATFGLAIPATAITNSYMPTPEEYRRYATLCDNLADTTDDKIERAMLLKLAQQWRRLANHKAKQERLQETVT
jgi:hypothetical protein